MWTVLLTNKMFCEFWRLVLKRPCLSCLCCFEPQKPTFCEESGLPERPDPCGGEALHLADSSHLMLGVGEVTLAPPVPVELCSDLVKRVMPGKIRRMAHIAIPQNHEESGSLLF